MALKAINSADNIQQPHGISAWFRQDYTGNYLDMGDILVDGLTFAPEFSELPSYRNGARAVRRRTLSSREGQLTFRTREAHPRVLSYISYGSTPVKDAANNFYLYDGRHMEVLDGGSYLYVDFSEIETQYTDYSDYDIIGVYADDDPLLSTALTFSGTTPDASSGELTITDSSVVAGDTLYVMYKITQTIVYKTTIFQATDATVEGALQLQARNQSGGILQVYDLASVQLAPNGELSFPLDDIQEVPIIATIQEYQGSFGTIWVK